MEITVEKFEDRFILIVTKNKRAVSFLFENETDAWYARKYLIKGTLHMVIDNENIISQIDQMKRAISFYEKRKDRRVIS